MEYKNLDNRILFWLVKERKEKDNNQRTLPEFYLIQILLTLAR